MTLQPKPRGRMERVSMTMANPAEMMEQLAAQRRTVDFDTFDIQGHIIQHAHAKGRLARFIARREDGLTETGMRPTLGLQATSVIERVTRQDDETWRIHSAAPADAPEWRTSPLSFACGRTRSSRCQTSMTS